MAVHVGGKGPGHLARVMGAWTPAELGSSLLGWWDAEDASTLTTSGGLVSSWRDKKVGYDAVQATGASKPVYSATSFNSRPGLTFDGADDELTYAGVGAFPTGANPGEIWFLGDQQLSAVTTGFRQVIAYGGATANDRRTIIRDVATGVNRARATAGTGGTEAGSNNASVDFSGRHVVRAIATGANVRADVDAVAGGDVAAVPVTGTTRTRLGANTAATAAGFFQGVMAVAIITAALSDTQAAQLAAYLKARGGIA